MIRVVQDPKNKAVYFKINSITRDVRRGIRQAYYQIGKELKSFIKDKFVEPKHGREYVVYRGGRRIKHTASAEGEYPWSRGPRTTGRLRKSLGFKVRGSEQLELGAGDGADMAYAKYLEEKMNRPYLSRSAKEKQKIAIEFFNQEIEKALKGK